ncbi:MAG: hypothetical protein ACRD2C_11410 [Acidimicrobiales bacterium]
MTAPVTRSQPPAAGPPTDPNGTPALPAPSPERRTLLRALRLTRGRPRHAGATTRFTTPQLLRVSIVGACLAIAVFALVVQIAASRTERATDTMGAEVTQPVTLAQQITLDLAELDQIVVNALLQPGELGASDFPDAYDSHRRGLQDDLVALAAASPGDALRQRLVDLDYALAHYHALVRESLAAADSDDPDGAAVVYGEAHTVMRETLLPEADSFAEASQVVVANDYDGHRSDVTSLSRLVLASWVLLLAVLLAVGIFVAKRFRRMVNVAVVGATVLALVAGGYTFSRLDKASSHLASAYDRAFGAIHALGQARVTTVAAWQADGLLLLDPSGTMTRSDSVESPAVEERFAIEADQLFQVPDPARGAGRNHRTDRVDRARAGEVPDGATGHLAVAFDADVSDEGNEATSEALVAFARFLDADAELRLLVDSEDTVGALVRYQDAEAFDRLVAAIDDARAMDQHSLDHHAGSADDTSAGIGWVAVVASIVMVVLVVVGLYPRLREYRS